MNQRPISIFVALCASICPALAAAQPQGPQAPPGEETAEPPPEPKTPPAPPAPAPAPPAANGANGNNGANVPNANGLFTFFTKFKTSFVGFIEVDAIHDSTEAFQDGASNAAIARSGTYAGGHGRFHFTSRNTRLGIKMEAPEFSGVRASTLCAMDFFGNQPANPPAVTENQFLSSPTARLLHCYLKAETNYIDVLAGLTYYLFGQQNYFFPSSAAFLGLPGMIFSRAPQIRLSHTFKSSPLDVYIAAAADRPPQRDAELPDVEAALRVMINPWKGAHTPGALGTMIDPLSFGISGLARKYRVQELSPTPLASHTENSAGISLDALIPIIPANSLKERGNSLTATGSFVTGYGMADLYLGLNGGVKGQNLPPAAGAPPGAAPTQLNIDPGLAMYDPTGALHAVDWQSYQVGLQYYLPGSGDVWITGNYTFLRSDNIAQIVPPPKTGVSTVFNKQRYWDVSLFWAITPAVQVGLNYGNTHQTFTDGGEETNHRATFAAYYAL
jgi:hypothetical protein